MKIIANLSWMSVWGLVYFSLILLDLDFALYIILWICFLLLSSLFEPLWLGRGLAVMWKSLGFSCKAFFTLNPLTIFGFLNGIIFCELFELVLCLLEIEFSFGDIIVLVTLLLVFRVGILLGYGVCVAFTLVHPMVWVSGVDVWCFVVAFFNLMFSKVDFDL